MTKRRSTKGALLMSVLSLFLCFSMLLGTTFAWFTDEVESGKNVIKSGNLDITLEYFDGSAWQTVEGASAILDETALWEPGYTEVAYFRIKNNGSLALKYQFGVNIVSETEGVNKANEPFKLSDYIYFDVVEGVNGETARFADRNAAMANATETTKISAGYSKAGELKAGSAYVYLAMVIYMPTTVGNAANHNGTNVPQIELGVNVLATQLASESDGFDTDYDEDAVWADHYVDNATELQAAINEGGTIALMSDIVLGATNSRAASQFGVVIPKGADVTINLNGFNIVGDTGFASGNQGAFQVKGNLTVEGEGTISMTHTGTDMVWSALSAVFSVEGGTLTLGEGVTAIHNGGTSMAYVVDVNSTLGETVLNVNGAILDSSYVGVRLFNNHNTAKAIVNVNSGVIDGPRRDIWKQYDKPAEINIAEGIAYTNENEYEYFFGTAIAGDNASLNDAITSGADIYLVGGEFTLPTLGSTEGVTIIGAADGSTVIGGENATTGFSWSNFGKDTTIKNVTFAGSTNGVRWSYANGGTSTFDNCTFAGDSTYGFHMDQSNGATLIFNNCTFSGFNAFAGDLVKVVFNNCTFLNNGSYGHTNIWSVAEFNNCTWGDKTSVSVANGGHLYFNGVEESNHHEFIGSAESLVAFADSVEDGDTWAGQYVVLVADIDLANVAWTPIGQTGATEFKGTFDGNGYTIKNLNVDSSAQTGKHYSSGLFGWAESNVTIKNVKIDGAKVVGNHNVAVIVGYTYSSKIINCQVTNAEIVCNHANDDACGDKCGVIVGYAGPSASITDCSVSDSTVSAGRDAGQVIGAGYSSTVTNCTATNVTVTAGDDCTGANVNNAVIGRVLG